MNKLIKNFKNGNVKICDQAEARIKEIKEKNATDVELTEAEIKAKNDYLQQYMQKNIIVDVEDKVEDVHVKSYLLAITENHRKMKQAEDRWRLYRKSCRKISKKRTELRESCYAALRKFAEETPNEKYIDRIFMPCLYKLEERRVEQFKKLAIPYKKYKEKSQDNAYEFYIYSQKVDEWEQNRKVEGDDIDEKEQLQKLQEV